MKARIKSIAIAVLLFLTLGLAQQIWLAPPPTGNKLIPVTDPKLTDAVAGRMMPAAMVVNFGGGVHTKTMQLKNLWPFLPKCVEADLRGQRRFSMGKNGLQGLFKMPRHALRGFRSG